jgi:transcriptional regulator with XRE-family HTH domain
MLYIFLVMLKKIIPELKKSEINLGKKLRRCRNSAKLTMQFVADNAGLSVGFISQVERGLTVPSLSSLRSISGVLNRPISHFLEQPVSEHNTTRENERVNYTVGEGAVSYERVSAKFSGSKLRSVIVHEPPGRRNEPISHDGEELFYIIRGAITVEVEGTRTILRQGDSIHFDSRKIHSTWNNTNEISSMLWCGTMDVFGEDTTDPVHKKNTKNKGASNKSINSN